MLTPYEYLKDRIKFSPAADFKGYTLYGPGDHVVGCIGFQGWTYNAGMCLAAFDDLQGARGLARAAFTKFFEGHGLAYAIIPAHAQNGLRLARWAGFRQTHEMPGGWKEGEGLILHEMRKDQCRLLS